MMTYFCGTVDWRHFLKSNIIAALAKLHSKEIWSLITFQNISIPTSQQYFKYLFSHVSLDWKPIYLLVQILTKNTLWRAFQYKVLNNVLHLNHKLFQFRASTIYLCSYCSQHHVTVKNLFSSCSQVISLWTEIKLYFVNDIKLIALCPQIANLDYTNTDDRYFITQNLFLLNFKF